MLFGRDGGLHTAWEQQSPCLHLHGTDIYKYKDVYPERETWEDGAEVHSYVFRLEFVRPSAPFRFAPSQQVPQPSLLDHVIRSWIIEAAMGGGGSRGLGRRVLQNGPAWDAG